MNNVLMIFPAGGSIWGLLLFASFVLSVPDSPSHSQRIKEVELRQTVVDSGVNAYYLDYYIKTHPDSKLAEEMKPMNSVEYFHYLQQEAKQTPHSFITFH